MVRPVRADDLVTVIAKHAKEKYLVPVSDVHKDDLFALLDAKKINYTKAVIVPYGEQWFREGREIRLWYVGFFSPSGISSLLKNFPDFKQDDIKIGCFGLLRQRLLKMRVCVWTLRLPRWKPLLWLLLWIYIWKNSKTVKNNDDKKVYPFKRRTPVVETLHWPIIRKRTIVRGVSTAGRLFTDGGRDAARASFLVSVPKKRFKRAVNVTWSNDRYVRLTGFVNMIYWNRWKRRIRAC